jgi:hypothetical protein
VSTSSDPDTRRKEEQQREGEGGAESFNLTSGDFTFLDIEPGTYRIWVTIGGYRTESDTVVDIPKPDEKDKTKVHDLGTIEFRYLRR